MQPGDIEKFSRCAVRFGCVPGEFAIETNHVTNQLRQVTDGDIFATADVDDFRGIIFLEQKETGGSKIVDVQKFTARLSRAPYDKLMGLAYFRFMRLAQKRGQHV